MEQIVFQAGFLSVTLFNAIIVFLAVIAWIALTIISRIDVNTQESSAFIMGMISLVTVALFSLYLFYEATIMPGAKGKIAVFLHPFVRYSGVIVFIWASATISSRLIYFLYQLSQKRHSTMSES